jgi:hypothetical protein
LWVLHSVPFSAQMRNVPLQSTKNSAIDIFVNKKKNFSVQLNGIWELHVFVEWSSTSTPPFPPIWKLFHSSYFSCI